jgi:hypothetical protein
MMWFSIYIIILVSSIVIGVYKFSVLNRSDKFFLLLLFSTIVSEIIAHYFRGNNKSNYFVYHIFAPLQYLLVALAYYYDKRNRYILISIPIMSAVSIFLSLWVQTFKQFNSYFVNIEHFIFIIFAIRFFRNLLTVNSKINLKDYSLFWISSGLLLFCVSNLFMFGTFNLFKKIDPIIYKVFVYLRYFTNYIYYSIIGISFIIKAKNIKNNDAD